MKRVVPRLWGTLILALLLTPVVAAWAWESYTGNTEWRVDVMDDESGCGGGTVNKSYGVSIQHDQQTAEAGSWGHGKTRGVFKGNTLSMTGRTVPDGAGASKIHDFDVVFTPDCMGFTGKYYWNYADSDMQCNGYTIIRGTRQDGNSCPNPAETPEEQEKRQIEEARAQVEDPAKEKSYADILAKDPQNFWANWDMAELKKKQGKYDEFFDYFDQAANNESIFDDTREKLKKEAAKSLHLSDFPTATTSPLLRIETGEIDTWHSDFSFKLAPPKTPAQQGNWFDRLKLKIWAALTSDWHNAANEVAGYPEKTGGN